MKKNICYFIIQFILVHTLFSQRNTILVIADDLSPDYFGFYNESVDTANTPNIRNLAKNGIVFREAWGSPLCSVTRAGILTGKFPFRTNIGAVITSSASPQIDTAEMSVAKLLKYYSPVKYNTACIGKWHLTLGQPAKYSYPNKCGFDLYSGNFNGAITDYYNYPIVTNGITHTITTYATTKTVNDAIDWLDTLSNSNPFFLWLAFNAPHTPLHIPSSTLTTVTGLTGTTTDMNINGKKYFKAALEALDTELGRLIQYLTTNNLIQNTDIIFIGDNGNDIRVSQNPNKYKSKNTLYNYGVRVPMIVSGPSVVNPNRISNALVSTTDLFSTILELNGFSNWINYVPSSKKPVDSRSFLSLIKDINDYQRDWIFTQKFTVPVDTNDGSSIRNSNYHLMRLDDGTEEFYNQTNDALENINLLNTSMTITDVANYNQLCDTLYNLIGGTSCLNVAVTEISNSSNVKIYPNPAYENLKILTNDEVNCMTIIDVTGKKLIKECETNTISINDLQSGFYFVEIETKYRSRYVAKFIKK